jgi:membrane protease subunit HflK
MTQMPDPFTHHHGPAEPVAPELDAAADPAQQALADALRVTFAVLKVLMLVLAVVYLFSGVFKVKQTERAVQLRFGRILDDKGTGLYLGLPFPIDTVVKVDVSLRKLELDKAFWFHVGPGEENQTAEQMAGRALNPEQDGSMLTGDHSLVHARWSVSYQVVKPEVYLRNVGSEAGADTLVRAAAEQGAIYAVAQLSADAAFRGESNEALATQRAQQILDAMDCGIRVTMTKQGFLFPASVRDAFQAVTNAQNDRRRKIDEAQANAARQYSQAAGAAAEPLLHLIQQYDRALLERDQAAADRLRALRAHDQAAADRLGTLLAQDQAAADRLDTLFRNAFLHSRANPHGEEGQQLTLDVEGKSYPISGDAAAIINQARADYNQVVKQAQVDQTVFDSYRPQYEHDPQLVLSRLWQQARQDILTGDIEKYVLPRGQQPWFQINRDPALSRERQEAALKAARTAGGTAP